MSFQKTLRRRNLNPKRKRYFRMSLINRITLPILTVRDILKERRILTN